MDSSPSVVLITGANGFVGTRLCHTFAREGFRVIAGVRPTADRSSLAGLDLEYRLGDITKPETLPAMVDGIDYLVHNAGQTKARHREDYFRVNEVGTANLMAATADHCPAVKRVILMSSLAAAGPSQARRPVTEDDPPHPITTYGESKLAGEGAALEFSDHLPLTILRPSGVYGPGDKEFLSLFKAVQRGIVPLIGDPTRPIQLVHVDDLARATFLAATVEGPSGEAVFVAEDKLYSMEEMIATLKDACGGRGFPLRLPAGLFRAVSGFWETVARGVGGTPMVTREKSGELLADWAVDTSKAKRLLGFSSRISLADGFAETYRWYRRSGWL